MSTSRPQSSIHEYGLKVLRSELVTRAVFENRAVRGLLGAIPGLDAYALLGKAWWHTTEMRDGRPRYDLVIFDGPASGHAALMLRIPQAILNVMPKGPLAGDARAIKELRHGIWLDLVGIVLVTTWVTLSRRALAAAPVPARE